MIDHPYKPHKYQKMVHDCDSRFIVICAGRRWGKSVWSINHCFKQALLNPGRYWIVGPTYTQTKSIYWKGKLLDTYIPEDVVKRKNENELFIELKNGSIIELKGSDKPDSLRGAGLKGVILDEYAYMRPSVWEEHIQPMIRDSKGWAVFISTPNGFNHFYDLVQFAKKKKNSDWEYFHFTSADNPYFPKKEFEKAKKETSQDKFAQEYLGDFTKKAGLVFPEFDTAVHVEKEKIQPSSDWVHYRSIDFGQTNPTAVLWIGVDKAGHIWVYDELYEKNLYTSELAHLIKAKSPFYYTATYGDSAAAQSIKDLSEHGIHVFPVRKTKSASRDDYIKAGIEKIKQYLKVQEGTGRPRLHISPHCQNLIFEFMNYEWKEAKEEQNNPEKPKKYNDHALDALRMFVYEYTRPVKITAKPYEPLDPLTGY